MTPFWLKQIPRAAWPVPRPRGNDRLEDEVSQMKQAGVDVLVFYATADEAADLGLSAEAEMCAVGGIEFRSFPIHDRETPSPTAPFAKFVRSYGLKFMQDEGGCPL